MKELNLRKINNEFENKNPQDIIKYILTELGSSRIVLASSLSIEDQVLTDMILNIEPKARIFFIDTGRHYQETYNVLDSTMLKYNFKFEIYAPNQNELERMVSQYGPNLFYESIDRRKECCNVRKVNPLKRALSSSDGWICGLRREQSLTRQDINIFEWDESNNIYKINPLAYWSEKDVLEYIHKKNVPYNTLLNKGFPSIGCRPCTRAVKEGEDIRSGRWWWESPEHKECGLHR